MANFKTTHIITIVICFIANTNCEMINCNFPATPVYEGDTKVTLSCVLNGIDTNYAVTVKRNGTEVTPRTTLNAATTYEVPNSRYTVRTTAPLDRGDSTTIDYFLDITDVIRRDDGWYVLEVLSDVSSNTMITTKTYILDVYYLPDGPPICSPDDVYVVLGNEVQLLCTSPAVKPSDSISLQWEYQNNILSDTTTISDSVVTSNLEFEIANVETVYVTCSMAFDQPFQDEPARSCQAGPIHFIDDPIVSVTPERLTLLPGEDASFTCNIVNDPIAARIWFHDGISSDRLVKTGDNNEDVLITYVQPEDSGTITCRVNTGATSFVETSAELIITAVSTVAPRITTKQLDVTSIRTDKKIATKTEGSSTQEPLGTEGSSEQFPALSSSAIIGIIVCIVFIVLIVIIVLGLLLWKSRRRDDSHEP